jgi:hypothetical protein
VKEVFYEKLTADGISAFDGAADIIKEAQALGWGVAVASSGGGATVVGCGWGWCLMLASFIAGAAWQVEASSGVRVASGAT